MAYEWCPYCEYEVLLLDIVMKQTCPECGKLILHCAICDQEETKCSECPYEYDTEVK